MKVAIIGAGSLGFTRRLVQDMLSIPEFTSTTFALTDIDKDGLKKIATLCKKMVRDHDLPATIEATTNRRTALTGADYVFSVVRVGMLDAFQHDIEVPLAYGIDQCVGDTLSVGGVFYALRTIPVLLDFCADIREVAPKCKLFLNHSNPMSMNSWAVLNEGGVPYVGLCHGVQGGARQIATVWGVPSEELDYSCVGINHNTWFVKARHKGRDLLDRLLDKFEQHPEYSRTEKMRIEVLRRFGYYSTESNGHLSEYLPWFRTDPKRLRREWAHYETWAGGETGGYYRQCRERFDLFAREYEDLQQQPSPPVGAEHYPHIHEHGAKIIEAMETGRVYRGHFNVRNGPTVDNLPADCVIEAPGYVDRNGISMPHAGALPIQCAATNQVSINVQRMAVRGCLDADPEMVKLAVMHDPLCGAMLDTRQISELCDDMFVALAPWLPQFKRYATKLKRAGREPKRKPFWESKAANRTALKRWDLKAGRPVADR